jgi:hypothetical protein
VNVTLLMTITCAARSALAAGERPVAGGIAEFVTSGGVTGPVESFCTRGGGLASPLDASRHHCHAFCQTTSSGAGDLRYGAAEAVKDRPVSRDVVSSKYLRSRASNCC